MKIVVLVRAMMVMGGLTILPTDTGMFSADNLLLPPVCDLCPRMCGAHRFLGEKGFCGADDKLMLARAALHFWEEPPLSGTRGSGAIFFSHCSLKCIYCQNSVIAHGCVGRVVSVDKLAALCLDLAGQGALNINFVTPTHYAPFVVAAVKHARDAAWCCGKQPLSVPVVWNTSGYECASALRALDGIVDIYLTDFKYGDSALAAQYSHAPDYPQVALDALDIMLEQVGEPVFDEVDGAPRMVRGVLVRHLMLPGQLENSMKVVETIHRRYGSMVCLSLMNQYTPVLASAYYQTHNTAETPSPLSGKHARKILQRYPELARVVSPEEYECLLDFADDIGVQDYFWQQGAACEESFIPDFDFTGL